MTEKQTERIKLKIAKYKKALAADKKHWGGQYDDSAGIRYLIPEKFIQIRDYKGALRYLNWFSKNFPDDSGYPVFLFEWTFILFQCGKHGQAEQKAHQTFFSNTYLVDKFFGKEALQLDKSENSNWDLQALAANFTYSSKHPDFTVFAGWLETVLGSRTFLDKANEFIHIAQQLKNEPTGPKRNELVERSSKLRYG